MADIILERPVEEEEQYEENWNYSRLALPWLLFCLICCGTLFALTFWQSTGTIKNQFDGVPRLLIREVNFESDQEGGLPKNLRNVRIAEVVFGVVGVIGGYLVYFARPKPTLRKALGGLFGLFILVAAVLAWVAFAVGMDRFRDAVQRPENWRATSEQPRNREGIAIAAVTLDALVGITGLTGSILLIYNCVKGHWKMAPRDIQEEQRDKELEPTKLREPADMIHKNVSYVRKWLVALNLFFCLVFLVGVLVFMILLHEDREVEFLRGPRGRAHRSLDAASTHPYEHAGWPTVNTRIRYAATAIGILTILMNFLPLRSRTVAIIFAVLYFITSGLCLIAFGWDVHTLRWVDKLPCPVAPDAPTTLNCSTRTFVTTAVMDLLNCVIFLVYLLLEYGFLGYKRQFL